MRKYVRDLEQAIVQTLAAFELAATTIEGLTGRLAAAGRTGGPRKIASIGVRVSRWVTTHGYALNVDLDPAPFTEWITACGLDDAAFTSMARELGRPVAVDDVKPAAVGSPGGRVRPRARGAVPGRRRGSVLGALSYTATGRRATSRQAGTTSGLRVQTR